MIQLQSGLQVYNQKWIKLQVIHARIDQYLGTYNLVLKYIVMMVDFPMVKKKKYENKCIYKT